MTHGTSNPLRLILFGSPQVTRADGTDVIFRSRKHLALLIYLAVQQRHSASRDTLLALLWPDADEEAARNNLRVALAHLRRGLSEAAAPFLQTTRHTVQFDPTSDHTLDVVRFRVLLDASQAHDHAALASCTTCLARLEQAVALYGGDFLAGFSLADSSEFEEWALMVREQLHQAMLEALASLADAYERLGDHTAQCRYARRQIELEPWREQAHAQLMRGLWASGQRGVALEQYQACRRILADELGLSPSPELTALYQQIRTESSSEVRGKGFELSVPQRTTLTSDLKTQSLHNLPTPTNSFVGRETDLDGVSAALASARLVTLTGAGGSGKTRLALQVAAAALPAYADGVWLVELASLHDPSLVPPAIAAALGLALPVTTGQPAGALLGAAVGSKQLLLILDNCEHLAQACRELAGLLMQTCPRIKILAASREILRVVGEVVWPVPALATPDVTLTDSEQLMGYESIQLFVERARAVRPGFVLTNRIVPAVVQICQRLDSFPLAIELAAARVRHMSVEAILARLDDRFSLLTAGSHTSSRQQTLRAAIDWSYALLPDPEQRCFRGLGVFAGSFTLPFAEAVIGDSPGSSGSSQVGASAIELLAQLIDKSLLVAEQRDDGMRYRLLESMRAYAQEKLIAAGEAAAVQERHLACFVRLAEEAEPHLFSADQVAWLDTLATEHNNLRAALNWAVEQADAHAALRLVTVLRSLWYTRGHYDEGQRRTMEVLAMPAAQQRTHVRAAALNAAAALLWAGGDADAALPLADEALAIGRELGDPWNIGWALLHQCMIAYRQGDHTSARRLLEDGLANCRTAGPAGQRGVGWGLIFLGDLAFDAGDLEQARTCFAESVNLLRELSDYGLLAYPLRRLAYLALQQGDFAAAKALCTESLRLNQAIDDRLAVVACLAAHAAIASTEAQAVSGVKRKEHLRHAANLCGAVAAHLEAIGAPLWPADAAAIERLEIALRDQLGPVAFADALAAGRAMSIDQLLTQPAEPSADALAPSTLPSYNLPVPLTPCIGREAELAELVVLLQKPEARLLTVVGVGGMGKTRLAQELGRTNIAAFADGVFFVPLAPISTPATLVGAIATALGIALQGSDPCGVLFQMLRQKHLMLILDNFEHLLVQGTDAVDLVADLIVAAPGVQLVVTSRERLKLRGEHVYAVQALTFSATASLSEAAAAAAVQLFVQSVQRVQADFQLTASNLAAVLRICLLVQGMPLGLELAAANADSLPLTAIADAIEQSAAFLTVDWRDVPERQRSMQAVFAWSWQLLSAEERRVLRQSAVFRGGFAYSAAQAVIGATPAILTRLTDTSLLQLQATASGEGRYTMHELLRQFAAEELNLAGERVMIEERHGRYYLVFLAARGRRLGRGEPKQASSELQAELDNIRLAWQWAVAQGRLAEIEQATYAWWQFCQFQGLEFEGRQSFAAAVHGVRRHLAQAQADEAAILLGQRLLAKLLALHANYLLAQGRDLDMAAEAREAVALGAGCGGVEGETFGTLVLGRALQDLQHKREAREMWQRTIQLVHLYQPEHPESELLHEAHWMAHNHLRGSALHFGDYAGSRNSMVQALQICQTLGKRWGELYCLAALAGIDFFLYDFAAAEEGFATALDLARTLNYRRVEMVAQEGLSGVLRLRGDYTRARALLEHAVNMAAELAFPYDEALFLAALIRLHCQLGDQAAAAQRHEKLTQLLARVKLAKECQLYGYLAAAIKAHSAGATQEALRYAEQADQLNQQGGDILFRLVDTALILGHVRAAVGQKEAATAAFRQALDAFEQFDNRALAAEPQAGLAHIALVQGDLAGAQAQIEAILPVLAEQSHAGYNNPFFIYLTCYRVLAANGDSRASAVLQQGYDLLQQDAAALDDNSRDRFLGGVPMHRNIVTAYAEMQAKANKEAGRPGDKETKLRVSLSPGQDWSEAPESARLYGRAPELAYLEQWLVQDRCRLVAVLGIGGVGKTSLAAAAFRTVAADFSAVVWRSLLNAPPLDELLRDVLGRLEPGTLADLPGATESQIGLLVAAMGRSRILLVLDNLESILRPDQPGAWRPGYEGYAQLLRAAAERGHQSCVLLTSRERPQGLGRLEEDTPLVRLLRLDGLDAAAGSEMLADRGLNGMDGAAGALVRHYSGNPLALRLVAQTVREVFDGDIRAFLEAEAPIFDDIGAVLEQQVARLPSLERELLTWLAIEREPVGALALRANLVSSGSSRTTLEAVRALLRRSLVTQSGSGLGLQNMIIEYLTETLIEQVVGEIIGSLSPGAPTADEQQAALNRFALCKAQAKDYVRASQARLILEPLAARALERLGLVALMNRLRTIIAKIQARGERTPGYAAGNILNLLLHLGADLRGADFSQLCVWQADLRGAASAALNFTNADLAHSAFTAVFDLAAVAFTAAGQLLVAGVVGDELCLWRAANGQLHDIFRRPNASTNPVAFSQDGQTLANCGLDGSVQVWSVASGDQVAVLYGHTDIPYRLAFSTDGQRLASGGLDGIVRVWDVASGQLQHIFYQQANMINELAFSGDGTLLAGGGSDQHIYLWDMVSGQVVGTLVGHMREIESLVFSGDSYLLISGAHDGSIRVWDVASGQSLRTLDGHSQIVRAIVLHPDGHIIASGSVDRTVKLWDIRDGQLLRTLLDHEAEVKALAFSPDGQMLASGSVDRTVKLWETRTGYALESLRGYDEIIRSVAFSPDGQLMASSGATGIVYLWEVHAQGEAAGHSRLLQVLHGHTREIRSVAFSPAGRFLATGGGDQIVQVWDVASGKVVQTLRGHTKTIKTLAWSPDGRMLASGGSDWTIRLWPLEAASPFQGGRLLRGHTDEISSLAFSPDGDTLLSSSLDHTARVWAIGAGHEIHVLTGPSNALSGAVFSPDGQRVIATRYDYTVHAWDVGNGRRPALLSGDGIEALLVAFSPDSETLACVARNQTIELRRVATGAVLQTLRGHQGEILALAFSPTAPILASSDWNGTIRVWDVATGACLQILRAEGPYAGMDITGTTGLSDGQRAALHALGAVERL